MSARSDILQLVEPRELIRWMIWGRESDPALLIVVVDDKDDNALTTVIARENMVPSQRFGGVWGNGQKDGCWLISFRLVELGGGLERDWFTSNIYRELLEAILDVPHLVAVVPEEIAGDARTPEAIAPRLGGSMIVEVDAASPQVAEVLAERDGN
jgi:hypothetical protein